MFDKGSLGVKQKYLCDAKYIRAHCSQIVARTRCYPNPVVKRQYHKHFIKCRIIILQINQQD